MKADAELKSIIDDIVAKLVKFINLTGIRTVVEKVITDKYEAGTEKAGIKFDINVQSDPRRKKFLAQYTFDNITGMNDELSEKLRKEVSEGVMNLEGINQLKKRVRSVMEVADYRAAMIARTEASRAENYGLLDGAMQAPIPVKKWLLITYDNRTSEVSKAMGRKYGSPEKAIALDETFRVTVKGKVYEGLAPPFMPNDRDVLQITQPA